MNILDFLDTRQGTYNDVSFSHGNTLPYTMCPFGMNAFVMQTRLDDVRYFNPKDRVNYGVRLTHQPSPWMGDFTFLMMNMSTFTEEEIAKLHQLSSSSEMEELLKSSYRPKYSTFKPHLLSYQKLRDRLKINLVPITYGASMKVEGLNQSKKAYFSLAIADSGEVKCSSSSLSGYTDQLSGSKYERLKMFFYINFDAEKIELIKKVAYDEDEHPMTMYFFQITGITNGEALIDVATSYISEEQAHFNYENCAWFSYKWDKKLHVAGNQWLHYLNKIDVQHADFSKVKTFYHCLYRTATFPQRAYEYDDTGQIIHYSSYTGQVEAGYYFINNGYWDTFRTNYPLYALIIPSMIPKFLKGILNIAREDKFLPKWTSPDERGLMPGTLVDGVIADAVVKGLIDQSLADKLLEAMIYTATTQSENKLEGRRAPEFYYDQGYVPAEIEESVNQTLDYAYSDFCIAQVASCLNHKEIMANYYRSSLNYRNLFDKSSGLMKPKSKDGTVIDALPDHRWGGHYTEGSAWQNSFSVFHNIDDLIELNGGDKSFYHLLSELINMREIFGVGNYGQEIHEMSEMAAIQFGQLAISNQPSFHIPYLFIYAGYSNMSHLIIKQLLDLFSTNFEGFPGDEDNGSLSSWFVLSSLGLYAVTPGTKEYVLGISIWDHYHIHLENGKIISFESDPQEPYLNVVTKRRLNDKSYKKEYITYDELMQGARLEQELGVIPSLVRQPLTHRPFSLNKNKKIMEEYQ